MLRLGKSLGVLLFVLLCSCSGKRQYQLEGGRNSPGADADLVARVNKDQALTRVDLRARHLPPPDRVQEGAQVFVAWYRRSAEHSWARVGVLEYDPGSRKADLERVSVPATSFEWIVTAERAPSAASPSGNPVLSQQVGDD